MVTFSLYYSDILLLVKLLSSSHTALYQLHSKPPLHDIVNNTKLFIYYHTSYLANANGTTEQHTRNSMCDE